MTDFHFFFRADKAEPKELQENVEQDSEAAGGSSWWGGYSSWMNKAVDSVSSVAEVAKQKVGIKIS